MIQLHPSSANPAREDAPTFIATTTALLLAGAASAAGQTAAGIYASNKQSSAQKQAALLQASAEDKQRAYLEAKDRQDQANFERTERLNREQADRTERNNRLMYDQTAAQSREEYDRTEALNLDQYNREEQRLAPFREQDAAKNRAMAYWLNLDQQHGDTYLNRTPPLALSHKDAYGGSSGGGSGSLPSLDLSGYTGGDWDEARVAAYFKSRGVTPSASSPSYWASKWQEFGKSDPEYFLKRLATADEFAGTPLPAGGGFGTAPTPPSTPTPPTATTTTAPAPTPTPTAPRTLAAVIPSPRATRWRPTLSDWNSARTT